MAVLVDTPIWSLAFRRKPAVLSPEEAHCRVRLSELIKEKRARIIGPVRQETLSGIREMKVFEAIRVALRSFPDEPLGGNDYEDAALFANRCRSAGIAGSPVDYLICAVARHRDWDIFTLDHDFEHYARVLKVRLYQPRHAD